MNTRLINPEIVIALAGTLVLALIFAIALGMTPSNDNMYDKREDPSKVALIAEAAEIIAAIAIIQPPAFLKKIDAE